MWNNCKRILCIRADNMGDVVMTTPALRALKESFGAHITLLTSSMAAGIIPFIPVIDEVMVADLPWVKTATVLEAEGLQALIRQLRDGRFDAAVIFTVYSQSALPSAMLAMMAGIPRRLAWCRENPYALLTDWVPDPEPYRLVQHQVERDLKLVNRVGAFTNNRRLLVQTDAAALFSARAALRRAGIILPERYVVFHPGVSEIKRQYPVGYWIAMAQQMQQWDIPVLITGTKAERELAETICREAGHDIVNTAGLLTIGEFIALIDAAAVVVSVNTATAHIAAARQKPVIVLYALTNPQHTPWQTPGKVFTFSIHEQVRSKNEVVAYVHDTMFNQPIDCPLPETVADAARALWEQQTVKVAQ